MIWVVALVLSFFVYYIYLNYKNFRRSTRADEMLANIPTIERIPNRVHGDKNCLASIVSASTSHLSSEDVCHNPTKV